MSAKFINYNLVSQPTTDIYVDSENALFPKENIKVPSTTDVFRTETGTLSTNIIFDFQTAEPVDTIIILGHHFDWLKVTSVSVQANFIDSWTSPPFSTTVDLNYEFNIGYKTLLTDKSYRYWRFQVANTANYVEIANIFIGKSKQLVNNDIVLGWTWTEDDRSTKRKNDYGIEFIDDIPGLQKSLTGANLELLNKDNIDTLKEIWVHNRLTKPLCLILDENEAISNDKETFFIYGRLSRPLFSLKNNNYALYDGTISIIEVV